MANTIDIFNSAKLKTESLIGENKVFSSEKELTEFNKKQERFLTNIDYSDPANFARFGSAEEYYKNCINYINSDYPHNGDTYTKLNWVNNLNEFEYYLFKNEYPRAVGHLYLSGTTYLKIFPPVISLDKDAKNSYNTFEKYFSSSSLDLSSGITFESWFRIENPFSGSDLLKIYNVSSSSSGLSNNTLFSTSVTSSFIKVSSSAGEQTFSYPVGTTWQHYCIQINTSSCKLFVNGILQEEKTGLSIYPDSSSYKFSSIGLVTSSLFPNLDNTGSYSLQPMFTFGGNREIYVDELRVWNCARTVEQIGRNWFKQVDGNSFDSALDDKLIFYCKFNEGISVNDDICYDYSGFNYRCIINNYNTNTRINESGLDNSGILQDVEPKDPIIESSINNSGTLNQYYQEKIESGASYDGSNQNMLYKKFPSWILMDEQENDVKYLKQVIQIVSSYFDDLFNKISELSKYKHIQNYNSEDSIYSFYDKILASTGFDTRDLFSNFSILEKIASRGETNLFDEDVQKTKNAIFQNIYNNLSYILKSKGTEKSIKSFLRSYGIDENLVKINVYSDGMRYDVKDRFRETSVKKKTLTLTNSSSVFLTGSAIKSNVLDTKFTLESSLIFPKNYSLPEQATTASVMGFFSVETSSYYSYGSNLQAYVSVEKENSKHRICFRTGAANDLVYSSSLYDNFYDGTVWNMAIGVEPNIDNQTGSFSNYDYRLTFRAFNANREVETKLSASTTFESSSFVIYPLDANSTFTRYFIGAHNYEMTGTNVYLAPNAKYLYCNFWSKYLSDTELLNHNKDITNYGVE